MFVKVALIKAALIEAVPTEPVPIPRVPIEAVPIPPVPLVGPRHTSTPPTPATASIAPADLRIAGLRAAGRSARRALTIVAIMAVSWLIIRRRHEWTESIAAAASARLAPIALAAVVMAMYSLLSGGLYRSTLRAVGLAVPMWRATRLAAGAHLLNMVVISGGLAGAGLFLSEARRSAQRSGSMMVGYMLASLVGRVALAVVGVGCVVVLWHRHEPIGIPLLVVAVFSTMTAVKLAAFGVVATKRHRLARIERLISRVRRSIDAPTEPVRAFGDDVCGASNLVRQSPASLVPALVWSIAGKVAGALLILSSVQAVGGSISPSAALVAYVLATMAGALSLIPGGVGAVELTLVAALQQAGVPVAAATSATLVYRMFQFWLPLVFEAASVLDLRAPSSSDLQLATD